MLQNMRAYRNQECQNLASNALPGICKKKKKKVRACAEKVLRNGIAHFIILCFAAGQLKFHEHLNNA